MATKRIGALALPASLLLMLQGCVYGILYTDVTKPLTLNMDATPNPPTKRVGTANLQRLQEPFSGLDIRVEVSSIAIGDAAKQSNLSTLYWADLRHQSILLGLWQKKTVKVYGQ